MRMRRESVTMQRGCKFHMQLSTSNYMQRCNATWEIETLIVDNVKIICANMRLNYCVVHV